MYVVSICEDDFNDIHEVKDEAAFAAFEDGFEAGAGAYGAGKFRVYLLPRDEAKMIEETSVGEVMRAHEEIARRDAVKARQDTRAPADPGGPTEAEMRYANPRSPGGPRMPG